MRANLGVIKGRFVWEVQYFDVAEKCVNRCLVLLLSRGNLDPVQKL